MLLVLGLILVVPYASPADASKTIAAAGDVSCPKLAEKEANAADDLETRPWMKLECQARRVARLIKANDPDRVLALGDLVQGQEPTRKAFSNFGDQWRSVRDRVLPTLGNHEYGWGYGRRSARTYFGYWNDRGLDSDVIGTRDRGWASWRIGRWHMINLDSNCFAIDCSIDGRQMRWLAAELKRYRDNPASRCLAAYFHHPLYSAGMPRGRVGEKSLVGNIWSLLYIHGADLVINGHQHFYERHRPLDRWGRPDETGITQVISGTGGSMLYRTGFSNGAHLSSSAARTSRYGATFFKLGRSSWSSVFKDTRGAHFDQTPKTACHAGARPSDGRKKLRKRYRAKMKNLRKLKNKKMGLLNTIRGKSGSQPYAGPRAMLTSKLRRIQQRLDKERRTPLR